jgi:hypothetical protein
MLHTLMNFDAKKLRKAEIQALLSAHHGLVIAFPSFLGYTRHG